MPSLSSEAVAMGTSALWVAAVALPVGGACAWLARRWREPVVPRSRKAFARWDGIDAAVVPLACLMLPLALGMMLTGLGVFGLIFGAAPPMDAGATVVEGNEIRFDYQNRINTVLRVALMPALIVAFLAWKRRANKERVRPAGQQVRRFVADVAAGVGVWLVLTPLTLAVHFAVNWACTELNIPPEEHPLKGTKLDSAANVLLFFVGTCLAAPFYEEMAFRRVMVPWVACSPKASDAMGWTVGRPYRAWVLMGFSLLIACTSRGILIGPTMSLSSGPPIFVGCAALALLALTTVAKFRRRFPLRPAAAILSTATFFAAVHSGVWPTPIPLLVLGIGLGWLVLRTKTVTAAVVAHGLFNAVSAVFLVRSLP